MDGIAGRPAVAALRPQGAGRRAARRAWVWERSPVRSSSPPGTARLDRALAEDRRSEVVDAIGELLFAVVERGPHGRVDPETALRGLRRSSPIVSSRPSRLWLRAAALSARPRRRACGSRRRPTPRAGTGLRQWSGWRCQGGDGPSATVLRRHSSHTSHRTHHERHRPADRAARSSTPGATRPSRSRSCSTPGRPGGRRSRRAHRPGSSRPSSCATEATATAARASAGPSANVNGEIADAVEGIEALDQRGLDDAAHRPRRHRQQGPAGRQRHPRRVAGRGQGRGRRGRPAAVPLRRRRQRPRAAGADDERHQRRASTPTTTSTSRSS